ncbi:MAG: hypothetical protein AAGC54_06225, partial [Cyanobacteria bacterium P01_F01_bin.4]
SGQPSGQPSESSSERSSESDPRFRWVTLGYGLSQPITENQTPEARQRNRRIEISVDTRR